MTDSTEGYDVPGGTGRRGYRIVAAVQARTASTRYPGKVLAPILGEPMICRIVERLRYVQALDGIVLATTTATSDDELCGLAESHGVPAWRGQVGELSDGRNDIARRLTDAGTWMDADVLVRAWGDCPCIDPQHIAAGLRKFFADGLDHLATFDAAHRHSLPYGTGFEVYRMDALAAVLQSPNDRDRVYPFEYVRGNGFRSGVYVSRLGFGRHVVLAVDHPDDLARTEAIYRRLYSPVRPFTIEDVLKLPAYVLEPGQEHERNVEYLGNNILACTNAIPEVRE